MITQEQLKEATERKDALRKYLDIDTKRIEVEEEELRTHVPDFWEHPAQAQAARQPPDMCLHHPRGC